MMYGISYIPRFLKQEHLTLQEELELSKYLELRKDFGRVEALNVMDLPLYKMEEFNDKDPRTKLQITIADYKRMLSQQGVAPLNISHEKMIKYGDN